MRLALTLLPDLDSRNAAARFPIWNQYAAPLIPVTLTQLYMLLASGQTYDRLSKTLTHLQTFVECPHARKGKAVVCVT